MRNHNEHDEPPITRLTPGTVLAGRYEITGDLGEGGFAVVYRGRDLEIDREIAVKVLNLSSFAHDKATLKTVVERFRREARTAARIHHSNAVTIFDFGDTPDGSPFIVMELLEGYDLDVELAQHGPMSIARSVRLFIPALEALGKAHKLGIVHKDLKPSNLFLTHPRTDEERMIILDFGVARVNSGDDAGRLTTDGQVLGTPQYMAPEYIESQTAQPTLDVYQMGLILAEAIIGKPIVNEDNMVTCLIIHTTGKLEIPVELLNSPVGEIIGKATRKDHTKRFTDGNDFRNALMALNLGAAPPPRPGNPTTPPDRADVARTEVVDFDAPGAAAVVKAPEKPTSWLVKLGVGAGVLTAVGVGAGALFFIVLVALFVAVCF